ncbi:hypothetical protein A1D23_03680 [Chelonobacter oris]|uniref:Lipoprotein n=1 Tax=Chelonobacter oris TaxID=505317 RepID=A0A0A3ARX7_9PAST|nr:hypothetical protein [Chelonobacter oris]KGQ69850.1 hypothetical protein OA57_09455 [Chelonobacter oris]MDH2999205.1 hypothetical protein [Chelonobacter oris]
MHWIKILLAVTVSLFVTACQTGGITKWNNATTAHPVVRVGGNTEKVIKISYVLSAANGNRVEQENLARLQSARQRLNQIDAESIAVEQQSPIALDDVDSVNPNAYLYIDDYNVRLGKVRIGLGKFRHLRIATLGSSDQNNIYSNLNIYNCRQSEYVTAIVYTYTAGTGETQVFAPDIAWQQPARGTAQRWLLNAVCSATLIKEDDHSLAIGYSVLLNQLG